MKIKVKNNCGFQTFSVYWKKRQERIQPMEKNSKKNQPNILLIMTDQMRGDCLGIAGHPDVKTPYLDHLASLGTRYSNA